MTSALSGGPVPGRHAGQTVAAQVAVALPVAAAGNGTVVVLGATAAAVALAGAALLRVRRRWAYEWLGVVLRRAGRRRGLPAGAGAAGLLALVHPEGELRAGEIDGAAAAVLHDRSGLVTVLEVGDARSALGDGVGPLPPPDALLPDPAAGEPEVSVQLVITAVGAAAGEAGNAREAGNAPHRRAPPPAPVATRCVLAVRVHRADGFTDAELARWLSAHVRKIRRRLRPVPTRPLDLTATHRLLAEVAHHDPTQPVREAWSTVWLGGLAQAAFRPDRWPPAAARLVPPLLGTPAAAATVALSAGPSRPPGPPAVDLRIRLAAGSPARLTTAERALRRLLATDSVSLHRLDGEHLPGVAATLPLAAQHPRSASIRSPFGGPVPPVPAGLTVGLDRHGAAVLVRLFRAGPTRAVLIGGLPLAQLLVLRAVAAGARVSVQTARPAVWRPLLHNLAGVAPRGSGPVLLLPPGPRTLPSGGRPTRPALLLVDVGRVPPPAPDRSPGALPEPRRPRHPRSESSGWCAEVVLREEATGADVDLLTRADLVITQPLPEPEAVLVGGTTGLGETAGWLSRISTEMVGVISDRTVRWALLTPSAAERQVTGTAAGRRAAAR